MSRSDLRAAVVELSGGRCEWPQCELRGVELAHATSIGMGGKHAAADTVENCALLCSGHARVSDLGPWPGAAGYTRRDAELKILFDAVSAPVWPLSQFEVARAMRQWIARERGVEDD